MTEITSSSNAHFKVWKSLLSSKGIKKEGLFLLSGEKLIREALASSRLEVVAELVPPQQESITRFAAYRLSSELFRELDELGTHGHILVVKTPEITTWDPAVPTQGLDLICPFGDPQNLGAALRSAEAFGVSQVILTEEAANPFLPKSLKASSGSSLRVKLARGAPLRELTGELIALDLDGTPLNQFTWPSSARLIIGEEGPGLKSLSSDAKIKRISIPTQGVESLNAAVATSIALFHYRSQN